MNELKGFSVRREWGGGVRGGASTITIKCVPALCAVDRLAMIPQSMKLHRGKLKTYLERVDSFYQAENMYHNAWHAADVVQRVAVIMAGINLPMTAFDNQVTYLAAILGAAIHDAAHPGRDNKFMIRHEEVLARRFNNQHVLENHSLHLCLEMMREEGTDFLEGSRLKSRKMSLNVLPSLPSPPARNPPPSSPTSHALIPLAGKKGLPFTNQAGDFVLCSWCILIFVQRRAVFLTVEGIVCSGRGKGGRGRGRGGVENPGNVHRLIPTVWLP